MYYPRPHCCEYLSAPVIVDERDKYGEGSPVAGAGTTYWVMQYSPLQLLQVLVVFTEQSSHIAPHS